MSLASHLVVLGLNGEDSDGEEEGEAGGGDPHGGGVVCGAVCGVW